MNIFDIENFIFKFSITKYRLKNLNIMQKQNTITHLVHGKLSLRSIQIMQIDLFQDHPGVVIFLAVQDSSAVSTCMNTNTAQPSQQATASDQISI